MSNIIKIKVKDLQIQTVHHYTYEKELNNNVIPPKRNIFTKILKYIPLLLGIRVNDYDWKKLKKSIEENGYDPEKYGYIETRKRPNKEGKIEIYNGNHRAFLLQKMFGEDYELEVRVNKNILKLIADNIISLLRNRNTKPKIVNKVSLNEKIIRMVYYSQFAALFIYVFGFHFAESAVLALLIYLIYVHLKPATDLKIIPDNKNKIINLIIKNLYYNSQFILTISLTLVYTVHLILTDFLGFMAVMIYCMVAQGILKNASRV